MLDRLLSRFSSWTSLSFTRAESRLRRFDTDCRDERGAITIEYILIIALIAIIIISLFLVLLWPMLEEEWNALIEKIRDAIQGGNINQDYGGE